MNKKLWKSLTILAFAIWTSGTWTNFPHNTGEEILVCLVINALGLGIAIKTIESINNFKDKEISKEEI